MTELVWLVPLMPLLGFIINGLGFKKLSKNTAAIIGCGTVLVSFVMAAIIFFTDIKAGGQSVQILCH